MQVGDFGSAALAQRLRTTGIHLDSGAFTTHLNIELPHLAAEFAEIYDRYRVDEPPAIDNFHVRVASPSLLRRYFRPQVQHWVDGVDMMEPLPLDHAFPFLESALNLAIATDDLGPLVVHSAMLERDGRALVMPAPSGSGKSTLCAALSWRGWRLMSDEITVFCFESGGLRANPRPVSLKNRSVDVIAAFEPRARFTRVYRDTTKGDLAYMKPPDEAVARASEGAGPGLLVAPVYRAGAPATLRKMDRVEGLRWLIDNAVNYSSLLRTGFDLLTHFVERSRLYSLTYSNLDEAIALINQAHEAQ